MERKMEQDREQALRKLARRVAGKQVHDKGANKILEAQDWLQFYPVADKNNGRYTGEICGADEAGYTMYDSLYCVEEVEE
jgi:hypothetical protein